MAKAEIIQDRIEVEKARIVLELAIPMDFLREAMRHPENMEKAFALAFAEAMKEFLIKKNIAQPSHDIITEG
jgi:hypothetical protein